MSDYWSKRKPVPRFRVGDKVVWSDLADSDMRAAFGSGPFTVAHVRFEVGAEVDGADEGHWWGPQKVGIAQRDRDGIELIASERYRLDTLEPRAAPIYIGEGWVRRYDKGAEGSMRDRMALGLFIEFDESYFSKA